MTDQEDDLDFAQRLNISVVALIKRPTIVSAGPQTVQYRGIVLQTVSGDVAKEELEGLLKLVIRHCQDNLTRLSRPQIVVPGPERAQ